MIGRVALGAALLTTATLLVVPGIAQQSPVVAGCPTYRSPDIATYLADARRIAARDPAVPRGLISNLFIVPRLAGLCAPPDVPPPRNGKPAPLIPTRAFDQLYFVGTTIVGSWVLRTDRGLILFDAMNDAGEARTVIEPGLRALGLDPADIRLIVLTHGHGDHWGGAGYLQQRYGARVWLASADRGLLALRNDGRWPEPPRIDGVIRDGMTLALGRSRVRLYVTPGHTPGSVTAFIPVTDRGARHLVALSGGTGLAPQYDADPGAPPHHAGLRAYIASVRRVIALGRAAGIDGAISTHPFFDGTADKIARVTASPGSPSPWIMGRAGWRDYERVVLDIALVAAAMAHEHPERACVAPTGTAAVVCGRPLH